MLTPVLKHPEKVVVVVVIKPEVPTDGKQISVGVKFQFGIQFLELGDKVTCENNV
jgi:hypothetical protein